MLQLEKKFLGTQIGISLAAVSAAILAEKSGFSADPAAVACGAAFSTLTFFFYLDLIRALQGSASFAPRLLALLIVKLLLLSVLLLKVSELGTVWVFSALGGYLSIVPAGLIVGLRAKD